MQSRQSQMEEACIHSVTHLDGEHTDTQQAQNSKQTHSKSRTANRHKTSPGQHTDTHSKLRTAHRHTQLAQDSTQTYTASPGQHTDTHSKPRTAHRHTQQARDSTQTHNKPRTAHRHSKPRTVYTVHHL